MKRPPARPTSGHPPTLIALVIFTLISLGLGVVANFAQRKGTFLEKYFLGNRSLGAFAVALTAAVMSGGTFMGFPSLVYKFGWVVGSLDLLVHGRPLDRPGRARQARSASSRGGPARSPFPTSFANDSAARGLGTADQPGRHFFSSPATLSRNSRRAADHEDRPPRRSARPGSERRERRRRSIRRYLVGLMIFTSRWWPIRCTAVSSRRSGPTCFRASSWRSAC